MKDHIQIGGKSIKLKDIPVDSALLLAKEIVNNMNNRKANKTKKANKHHGSKTKKANQKTKQN